MRPDSGFTLIETMVALTLTAIIGAVMFKTWDMATRANLDIKNHVAVRERERVVFAIMDNDVAAILPAGEEDEYLPIFSKSRVDSSDEFYEIMEREKETSKNETILMSFASGSSLKPDGAPPGFPVCVEYVARGAASKTVVRRERDYCGVSGDFPWLETELLSGLDDAGVQLINIKGERLNDWSVEDLRANPPAARFYWRENGNEREFVIPLFDRRVDVDWNE